MKARLPVLMLLGLGTVASAMMQGDVREVLASRCLGCHSTEKQKGDLDLEASDIQKDPDVWEHDPHPATFGDAKTMLEEA